MAYIRRRTSKAGAISTALVEAYRDGQGRPRQRLLANLHGELTPLKCFARGAIVLKEIDAETAIEDCRALIKSGKAFRQRLIGG
jgi:hypothetical protein